MTDGTEHGLMIRPLATTYAETSMTCLRLLEYGGDRSASLARFVACDPLLEWAHDDLAPDVDWYPSNYGQVSA